MAPRKHGCLVCKLLVAHHRFSKRANAIAAVPSVEPRLGNPWERILPRASQRHPARVAGPRRSKFSGERGAGPRRSRTQNAANSFTPRPSDSRGASAGKSPWISRLGSCARQSLKIPDKSTCKATRSRANTRTPRDRSRSRNSASKPGLNDGQCSGVRQVRVNRSLDPVERYAGKYSFMTILRSSCKFQAR
jgi:hypothetical protein